MDNSAKIVVSGEDVESEGEDDEFDRASAMKSIANSGQNSQVVTGEAPESDEEVGDFGSTISLDSSSSIAGGGGDLESLSRPENQRFGDFGLTSIITAIKFDNSAARKHRERNKLLRTNITEKFLKPVITQNIKKLDKFSQNLSNSQMQMQEGLFQSRIATSNLLKLQKEFENLNREDYLKELNPIKINIELSHLKS